MRAIILKESDFEDLRRRLELTMFQAQHNHPSETSPEVLHRWFNHKVCKWIDDVSE